MIHPGKKRDHTPGKPTFIYVFFAMLQCQVSGMKLVMLSTSLWTLIISATMHCSTDMLDSALSLDDFWAQAVVQQRGLAEDRSAGSSHQSCQSPLGHSSQRYP